MATGSTSRMLPVPEGLSGMRVDAAVSRMLGLSRNVVEQIIAEELVNIRAALGAAFDEGQYEQAKSLFTEVALADDYVDFLTLPAYERMP